jgi:hypothetical protein
MDAKHKPDAHAHCKHDKHDEKKGEKKEAGWVSQKRVEGSF